jgi:hypothetical protein
MMACLAGRAWPCPTLRYHQLLASQVAQGRALRTFFNGLSGDALMQPSERTVSQWVSE